MKNLADYHTHTALCKHAKGDIEDYVRTAVDRGLAELGFADHAPEPIGFDPGHRMNNDEMPDYIRLIDAMRAAFPQIRIRLGLEVDCYTGFESYIEGLKSKYALEYIIGSVHFVQGVSIFHSDPFKLDDIDSRAAIQGYFDGVQLAARSGVVDVIGHLDVLKIIFPDNREIIYDIAEETLRIIAGEGKIMEMNLSGYRKPHGESYPDKQLLVRAAYYKIPVCLGADAHRPGQVAMGFEQGIRSLSDAGYGTQEKAGPDLIVFRAGQKWDNSNAEKFRLKYSNGCCSGSPSQKAASSCAFRTG